MDKDDDQILSYDEFRRFLRPEDDDELRRIEIDSIIKEYDENDDKKISNDEYLKMTGTFPIESIKRISIFFFQKRKQVNPNR